MTQIKLSIEQIRCKKVTHPRTMPDQIYAAYTVGIGKRGQDGGVDLVSIVGGCLSKVKTGVNRKHGRWVPQAMDGTAKMASSVDVGDASVAIVCVGLYEEDDGKLWEKMAKQPQLTEMLSPETFKFSKLKIKTDCGDDYACWIKMVLKNLWTIGKHLRQDDWLGFEEIVIPLRDGADSQDYTTGWKGLNEFSFKRRGGDYRLTTKISTKR